METLRLQGGAVLPRSPEQRIFAAAALAGLRRFVASPVRARTDRVGQWHGCARHGPEGRGPAPEAQHGSAGAGPRGGQAARRGRRRDRRPPNYNFKIAPCDPHHARGASARRGHLVRARCGSSTIKPQHRTGSQTERRRVGDRVVVGATACHARRQSNSLYTSGRSRARRLSRGGKVSRGNLARPNSSSCAASA